MAFYNPYDPRPDISASSAHGGESHELSTLQYDSHKWGEDVSLLRPVRMDSSQSKASFQQPLATPHKRYSRRLIAIHAFHIMLLVLNVFILIVSIKHWEHSVQISVDDASNVTSYISVAFQVFFTACILILVMLSSGVAVDFAIRHPRNLGDLDLSLYAWNGLGSSLSNIFFKFSQITSIPLSVSVGIPLYFIAGEVLKVTSSTVLGVEIYNTTSHTVAQSGASNHVAALSYPGVNHAEYNPYQLNSCQDMNAGYELGLWRAARANLFLPTVNNTLKPGIQGRVLHDTPNSDLDAFDIAHVNSTRMSVECSQVDDAFVEYFVIPSTTEDEWLPTGVLLDSWELGPYPIMWNLSTPVLHADSDGFTVQTTATDPFATTSDPWLNITVPGLPPYWQYFWGLDNFADFSFSQKTYTAMDNLFLNFQPFGYLDPYRSIGGGMGTYPDMNLTGLSHQMVFSVASTNRSLLLTDGTGSQGKVHNVTILLNECAANCTNIDGATCYANAVAAGLDTCYVTNYVQVLGCALRTSKETLSITQTGLLSSANTTAVEKRPDPHSWTSFAWEDPDDNDDFLGKEFLTMLVPTTCSSASLAAGGNGLGGREYRAHDTAFMRDKLVSGLMTNGSTIQNLEDTLELLSASYLWNVGQICGSLPYGTSYDQCNSTSLNADPERLSTATLVTTQSKARLAIVRWKAVVTVICSIILVILAFLLLGTTTDRPTAEALREARFIESAMLMKDSRIPAIVEAAGQNRVRLRYGVRPTGDGFNIDIAGHADQ